MAFNTNQEEYTVSISFNSTSTSSLFDPSITTSDLSDPPSSPPMGIASSSPLSDVPDEFGDYYADGENETTPTKSNHAPRAPRSVMTEQKLDDILKLIQSMRVTIDAVLEALYTVRTKPKYRSQWSRVKRFTMTRRMIMEWKTDNWKRTLEYVN